MARTLREAGLWGSSLKGRYPVMVTLTYRPDVQWRPSHVRDCLHAMRKWAARRGQLVPYMWVMELTKAGVPHYHIMLWVPKSLKLPMFDRRGWWPWGFTNVTRSRDPKGTYLVKYVSKNAEARNDDFTRIRYPAHCRVHGHGSFRGASRDGMRYWLRPEWLRRRTTVDQVVRRLTGGYVLVETGEVIASPYRVRWGPDGGWLLDMGVCFHKEVETMEVKFKVREIRRVKRGEDMVNEVTIETTAPIETHQTRVDDLELLEQLRQLVDGPFVLGGLRMRAYRDRVFLNLESVAQPRAAAPAAAKG